MLWPTPEVGCVVVFRTSLRIVQETYNQPRAEWIMDPQTATLVVGLVSSAVTVGGWIVLHHFTIKREAAARRASDARSDSLKRLEISLKQTESQIAEFYGPIYGLILQIGAIFEVKERMKGVLAPHTYQRVEHYISQRYFSVLHEQMRLLMREKTHLIEGVDMPPSFYHYVKHSVMENIQVNLWDEKQIDTSTARGIGWPMDLPNDVKAGLKAAMERYETLLADLRSIQNQEQAQLTIR
jgi:hypothetical protein